MTERATLNSIEYAGYRIHPKKYTSPYYVKGDYIWDGYEIEKIGQEGINPMPAAAALFTENQALQAVDLLIVSEGDTQKFWHLHRAINLHRD